MTQLKKTIKKFLAEQIKNGQRSTICIHGSSMLPNIASGDVLNVVPIKNNESIKIGDVVVASKEDMDYFVVHKVVETDYEKQVVILKGDNQCGLETQRFLCSEIIGKVHPIVQSHNDLLIVVDLPFSNPTIFNPTTYEIFQAVKSLNNSAVFVDLNIAFNRMIYGEKEFDKLCNIKDIDYYTSVKIVNYMQQKRKEFQEKNNIKSLYYNSLAFCNYSVDAEIKNLLRNYKNTIYYTFFKSHIINIFDKYKMKTKKPNIILNIDSFDKLIASCIFSRTLQEICNLKPYAVNNSSIFDGQFDTSYWQKFFQDIVSMSQVCRIGKPVLTNYDDINFNNYLFGNTYAKIRIRQECYYKKCLFCDRHNKDNFSYNTLNIVEKIISLNKKGVSNIIFVDDCLVVKEMLNILNTLKDLGVTIKWRGNFRFDKVLNQDLVIKQLSELGCKMIFFGFESCSQEYLDAIHKGILVEDAINILKLCKKYNIKTSVSFLFGFPLQTIESLKTTKDTILKYYDLFDYFELNTFVPTKNSKYFNGNLKSINYTEKPVVHNSESLKYILEIKNIIKNKNNNSFYFRNVEIWR